MFLFLGSKNSNLHTKPQLHEKGSVEYFRVKLSIIQSPFQKTGVCSHQERCSTPEMEINVSEGVRRSSIERPESGPMQEGAVTTG